MITHLMQPKDIAREYWLDLDRATYWMNKKSGGIDGRARTFNNMIYDLYCGAEQKRSEIFFYDSPKTGNHWMMWDSVKMGKNGMLPESYRVCYQLTEQYMCIMAPTTLVMQEGEPMNGITIYTPHLFQRMHERLGVDMGADKDEVYATAVVGVYVTRALCDLNYAEPTDFDFWKNSGEANKNVLIEIAQYWLKRKHVDREFVSLFEQIFKNVGIKQYNVMEFINYIFEKIKEDTKKFEQEK